MDEAELIAAGLAGFDRVVGAIPGFRPRAGQRAMALEVARAYATATLGETSETPVRAIAVVQAGTGVGKSAAYTSVGIAIARERKTRLLLSSSTVALQEQLANKDLPLLARTMQEPFTFAIAKGRSRYVCRTKLARRAMIGDQAEDGLDFEDDEQAQPSHQPGQQGTDQKVVFYRSLVDALDSGWMGDRDSLPEQPEPRLWSAVAADRFTCTVKACPQFQTCSYYQARRALARVDVIVANHDLVLASIGARTLPELNNCLVAFDEGHNLPKTAIEQFASKMDLSRLRWLDKLPKAVTAIAMEIGHPLSVEIDKLCRELKAALSDVGSMLWENFSFQMRSSDGVVRFGKGQIPELLAEPLAYIRGHGTQLHDEVHAILMALREKIKEEPELNAKWSKLFSTLGGYVPRVDSVHTTSTLLATEGDDAALLAKWASADIGTAYVGLHLHACPILPGDLLAQNLWAGVRAAVVTSATLTSCGKFDYFMGEVGLDRDPAATTKAVPSPFDFARQGEIVIRRTRSSPKALAMFNKEVSQLLAIDVGRVQEGALALFTSRAHMLASLEAVPDDLRGRVLVQGSLSRPALLMEHRRRVEAGHASIIFGLQSFGEGLDLPGALCSEIFICKLPFAPPTNPVDEARAEFVEDAGGSPFDELVVPATGMRLLQWTGRGVRTESDWARITCFDSRLTQRDFGRRILSGLPPYPVREVGVGEDPSPALI